MKTEDAQMVLEGIRVLNLARDRGLYAGKLLADLGADVLKIENPEGDAARGLAPFKDDVPGREKSLYFLSFHTNQKGITLDIRTTAGQDIFKKLVKQADVVVDDSQPDYLASLGLGYPVLREINPGIVMASISGFGRNGPYSDYKAPDIVSFAMGGLMFMSGDPAKPPVAAPCEQAYHSASVLACFGVLAALYHRRRTGSGQFVEVSAQEAIAMQEHLITRYDLEADIVRRRGSQHTTAPSRIYPCRDGAVYLFVSSVGHWRSLLEVMGKPEMLMDEVWEDGRFRRLNIDVIDPCVKEFTLGHTKMELTEICQSHGIPCTPVNTPEEFAACPHVKAREFITETEHPVIGKHRCLGPPYKLSETPCRIRRPAPLLGQHNADIYSRELGYAQGEIAILKTEGVI